jgi:hypothetical protein
VCCISFVPLDIVAVPLKFIAIEFIVEFDESNFPRALSGIKAWSVYGVQYTVAVMCGQRKGTNGETIKCESSTKFTTGQSTS